MFALMSAVRLRMSLTVLSIASLNLPTLLGAGCSAGTWVEANAEVAPTADKNTAIEITAILFLRERAAIFAAWRSRCGERRLWAVMTNSFRLTGSPQAPPCDGRPDCGDDQGRRPGWSSSRGLTYMLGACRSGPTGGRNPRSMASAWQSDRSKRVFRSPLPRAERVLLP